jgi:hypothetical protein
MSAEHVSELLQAANRLPDSLRAWLVQGLERWQQGQDLEQALKLLPDSIPLGQRDLYIRSCVQSCPGESTGAKCAFFFDVLKGARVHPDKSARQLIAVLQHSRVYIPKTVQHLRRILDYRRQDGYRVQGT